MPLSLLVLALADAPARFAGTSGPDLTRYITVCALLLVAIGGLAWGFRKLITGALRVKAAQRSLQIVDVLPLSNKQRVCVVRCYDRTFALGVGEKEIGLIAELDMSHTDVVVPAAAPSRKSSFVAALARARAKTFARPEGIVG
ncbi:MAG: FliO/MopB family protein [Planctomycetota bacterium]